MNLIPPSVIFLVISLVDAQAADICKAIALRDVPAVESPEDVLKRGDYVTAVTQYRVNRKTGERSLCSHGGYCYPTHVVDNGRKVEALRLTNCKVGQRDPYYDPDEVFYYLEVIRSSVSETELKIDDLENKLIEMGLCNACASNVAHLYFNRPTSQCSQLTKRALGGDESALQQLKEDPEFCRAW